MSKKKKGEKGILILLSGTALTTAVVLTAVLLLQYSGELIAGCGGYLGLRSRDVLQFAEIFGQLRQASFVTGWLPIGIVSLLLCAGCDFMFRKKSGKKKVIFSLLVVVILFLPLVFFGVCVTRVNGILFGDTLRILIPLLLAGGL